MRKSDLNAIKTKIVEARFSLESCRERVRDLEWQIEMDVDSKETSLLDERRKALDKIRFLHKELLDLELKLIREE